jgi:hypothetical protein
MCVVTGEAGRGDEGEIVSSLRRRIAALDDDIKEGEEVREEHMDRHMGYIYIHAYIHVVKDKLCAR